MPIFCGYRKGLLPKSRLMSSWELIKKYKSFPKNLYFLQVAPQICRFVKQKSNVMTFQSSSHTLKFYNGKDI